MTPTLPKRSIEAKDLFLIFLGWIIHRVLDFAWRKAGNNFRKRRRGSFRLLVQRMVDTLDQILWSPEQIKRRKESAAKALEEVEKGNYPMIYYFVKSLYAFRDEMLLELTDPGKGHN